jgi:hypothetical protein
MRLDPSYDSTMEDLMWLTEALQLMPVIEPFGNLLHVLKSLVSRLPTVPLEHSHSYGGSAFHFFNVGFWPSGQ